MTALLLACCLVNPKLSMLSDSAASYHGIDAKLFHAIILAESNYNKDAINNMAKTKSYGLAQLTADTAKSICGLKFKDIMEPFKNLMCGAKVFKMQLDRYEGDEKKALSAYNAGTYTAKNSHYVSKVLMIKSMAFIREEEDYD